MLIAVGAVSANPAIVGANQGNASSYSASTKGRPPGYAIIDLGEWVTPIKVTNSGWILADVFLEHPLYGYVDYVRSQMNPSDWDYFANGSVINDIGDSGIAVGEFLDDRTRVYGAKWTLRNGNPLISPILTQGVEHLFIDDSNRIVSSIENVIHTASYFLGSGSPDGITYDTWSGARLDAWGDRTLNNSSYTIRKYYDPDAATSSNVGIVKSHDVAFGYVNFDILGINNKFQYWGTRGIGVSPSPLGEKILNGSTFDIPDFNIIAMSDSGEIFGSKDGAWQIYDPQTQVVLEVAKSSDSGSMRDFTTLSASQHIVVGSYYWQRVPEFDPVTKTYTGRMTNDYDRFEWTALISSDLMWSNMEATCISDNGCLIVGNGLFEGALHGFALLKMDVVPDYDRDGKIDQADRGKVTDTDPYRFWINDDDDSGEWDIDDVPQRGNDADAKDLQVDGLRDLVDFFPLFFDLEDFLGGFDLSTVDLKLSGSSLNFIQYPTDFDGIDPANSWQYLSDLDFARTELADAATVNVSDDANNPTSLGADFVTLASEGKGVLLFEGVDVSEPSNPLVLHAFVNGTEIFTYEFPLKLSDVEDMYYHRNLQDAAKNYDGSDEVASIAGEVSRSTAPNWPDALTNGKYFVYLHGFKVDGQSARGEHAESFKRLHQMGSNTRFVGVTWHGAVDPDYHKGVYQAFETGEALNGQLGLSGDITVMAHSLGNVVVSNAIQNGGFFPDRYFMINAAVATEAYAFGAVEQDMVEEDWDSIPHRLHAAEWHKVFEGTTDARKNLKWRNFFAGVPQATEVVNFHSLGEDVLAHMPGTDEESVYSRVWTWNWNLARGAWKAQELVKGKSWLSTGGASLLFERTQAGWNRNLLAYLPVFTNWSNVTDEEIQTKPVFDRFIEDDLTDEDETVAQAKASEMKVKYDLLGRAIPALSYAAAIDPIGSGLVSNFDMETSGRAPGLNGEWPVEGHEKSSEDTGSWLHGDFRANALHFVYPMYREMINRGGLDDEN